MFTVMTLREGFTWEDENAQVYRIFTDSRKDAEKLANEYIERGEDPRIFPGRR